jgi:hypothetical protein
MSRPLLIENAVCTYRRSSIGDTLASIAAVVVRAILTLVDHIKRRSVADAVKDVLRNPAAARHLKMPVAARIKSAIMALQTPSSAVRRVTQ